MLEHGGRLCEAAARHGIPIEDWLDLSTGINPEGWPVPPLPASAWSRFLDPSPTSRARFVPQAELIVLRSLGKFFGLAGARVGFALAEPTWLHRLRDHLGPWTVAGPSRWVAARALADRRWQACRTRPTRAPERAARRVAGAP